MKFADFELTLIILLPVTYITPIIYYKTKAQQFFFVGRQQINDYITHEEPCKYYGRRRHVIDRISIPSTTKESMHHHCVHEDQHNLASCAQPCVIANFLASTKKSTVKHNLT